MSCEQSKRYAVVKGYHEQTKHHPDHYARSMGYLDWDNQPLPYRLFEGAPQIKLPLVNKALGLPYSALYESTEPAAPISLAAIAKMLELSMGLSAWKKIDTSEWALRINPSSGNLHPTECYLLLPEYISGQACLTHYNPYLHVLEQRAFLEPDQEKGLKSLEGFGIILTSIPWRESWKYGERAFRYCHHDLGHALGALRFACNLNGWKMTLVPQISEQRLDHFLGFNRDNGAKGEAEHADCLCWVYCQHWDPEEISAWFCGQQVNYQHPPNILSRTHVNWEIIEMVCQASQLNEPLPIVAYHPLPQAGDQLTSPLTAEAIIRKRRSAQNFNRQKSRTDFATLTHSLAKTLPANGAPFDVFPYEAQVHLALFIHAVSGLEPGLYIWMRNPKHFQSLKRATHASFDWYQVKEGLPLYLLQAGDFRERAQAVSCMQAIAGDGAYSLGMLAHFAPLLMSFPAMYPRLFWETGLVGQVLYLEAEAHALRATGIGCFFDDVMHNMLGLKDDEWQSLYHFTVGKHVDDARLQTKPPYIHLL